MTDAAAVGETLADRIERLDLHKNIQELDELGYTIIRDPAAEA